MAEPSRPGRLLVGLWTATAALTACSTPPGAPAAAPVSGHPSPAATAAPAPSPVASSSAPSPTASRTPPAARSPALDPAPRPSEVLGYPSYDPDRSPPATSGPLVRASLPRPAALGPGWAYRVDPGSSEEGYRTSGEPATQRRPEEVVVALAPFDCPDLRTPPRLPLPRHALEVTYVQRRGRAPGVGLALDMAGVGPARALVRVYADAQAACSRGRPRVARGTAVDVLARDASGAVVRRRDSAAGGGVTWLEAIAVAGRRVLLIALADTAAARVDPVRLRAALRAAA